MTVQFKAYSILMSSNPLVVETTDSDKLFAGAEVAES